MSVHIKKNNGSNKYLNVEGYDVKIIGGKRLIIPKRNAQTLNRSEQRIRRESPMSGSWSVAPSQQQPHPEKGVYNERPGPNHFGSVSLSAPAGSTSFNSKSVLPAIAPSEKTPSDTNLHYQHLATVSQPRTDSCEVDEILLKHSLGASLEATKEDTLHRLKNYLETKDTKHTNAHHPDDIYQEFGRFKINIPNNSMKQLFSKYESTTFPGFIEYKKLMAYLIRVKKLPVLDVSPLQSLSRNHGRKRPVLPLNAVQQSHKSQLKQEEMPILSELTLQLKNTLIDLPNLLRQFNEVDRERKGVLTRKQIEEILRKNNINLTPNLLDVMLYYCDRDGYHLYSTSKFLSYFDLVVKEDRSLLRGNRNISRPTRVQSPTLAFPPPLLEHTVDDYSISNTRQRGISEEEDFDYYPPLDRNEWLHRFTSMANALRTAPKDLPGFLPTEEVQHIAETYNTVYNLQIPQMLIGLSITRAYSHRHLEVDVNEFINHLQRTSMQQIFFSD